MAIQTLLPYDVNARNADSKTADTLGQSLEGLVNRHVQKMQQKQDIERNTQGYQEAWKLSPQQAAFVANQSPEFQQDFVKALHAQQQAEAFDRAIHPERYPSQPSAQPSFQPNSRPSLEETMGNMGTQPPQDAIAMALQKGLQQVQMGQPSNVQKPSSVQSGPPQPAPQAPTPQGKNIADILANRPLNPNLQAKAEELNLKKEQRSERSKEQSYAYNKEAITKSREMANRAKQDNEVLQSLIKANESGKLYQGPARKLLEKVGLEDVVTNTPTQFAAKQLERFVTGAPAKFGTGRFTNFLAESYQKGLPRLVNTKEAFDLIAKNIILENKAVEEQYKTMRQIIKESESQGKAIPYDLADQAIERAQPKLDEYAQESIKNLESALSGNKTTSFDSLPMAKDYTGKTITDTKTGTKYKSNGSKWVKA